MSSRKGKWMQIKFSANISTEIMSASKVKAAYGKLTALSFSTSRCQVYSMIIRALKSITGEQWQPAMWQQVGPGAWPQRLQWWCSKVPFNINLARKVQYQESLI